MVADRQLASSRSDPSNLTQFSIMAVRRATLLRCIIFSGLMSARGHERRIRANAPAAGRPRTADPAGGQGGFRLGPRAAARAAKKVAGGWSPGEMQPVPMRP
jgi:hypothetical protein